jgi:hypothetical protein
MNSSSVPLILRKFNINYISNNNLILIIGPPQSGKSIISKDILYNINNIKYGSIISNPHSSKKNYDYIPSLFTHESYNKSIINNFIKKQLKLMYSTEYNYYSFLIFDDSLKYKDLEKSKYLRKLFCGKVLNILSIIEIIELSKIYETLLLKNKFDYIFIMKEPLENNRRKIYNFIKDKLNIPFSLYCKFMDDYTDDYNLLVFDLKSESKYIEDKLFWYKAKEHKNFKIHNEELWNYANLHYNNDKATKDINNNIFLRNINYI